MTVDLKKNQLPFFFVFVNSRKVEIFKDTYNVQLMKRIQ